MHYQLNAYRICDIDESGVREKIVTLGDLVHDDLTGKDCKIVQIFHDDNGSVGFEIESDYLNGFRHPWELS